jgi:hypothetical protein
VDAGVCNHETLHVEARSPHPNGPATASLVQAQTYCGWRGRRLPTAQEWLWAARGRDERRTLPWGEEAPDFSRVYAQDARHGYGMINPPKGSSRWHVVHGDVEGTRRRVWLHLPTDRGDRPLGASRDGVRDLLGNVQEPITVDDGGTAYIGGSYFYKLPGHPDRGSYGGLDYDAKQLMAPKPTRRPHGHGFDRGYGIRCASDERPEGAAVEPQVLRAKGQRFHVIPGTHTLEEARRLCDETKLQGRTWSLPTADAVLNVNRKLHPRGAYWTSAGQRWLTADQREVAVPANATALVLCTSTD